MGQLIANLPAPKVHGPSAMLAAIFTVLDQNQVRYCITHGYAEYPRHIEGDVDCILPPDMLPGKLARLLRTNRRFIRAQIVQWRTDDAHFIVLSGRSSDGSVYFLQLHVATDYRIGHRVLYTADQVLCTRKRHGNFWIPSTAMEFACTLARRLGKRQLDEQHGKHLASLYNSAPAACRREMGKFLSDAQAAIVVNAMQTGMLTWLQARMPELSRQITHRPILNRPAEWMKDNLLRLRRWARPDGMHLVFLGPDGVGKSTVVDAVMEQLNPAFTSTAYRAFAPMLARRKPQAVPEGGYKPHELARRSVASSLIKAAWWSVYYTIGYLPTVQRDLAQGKLAVNHRYLIDALVDARRYRYSGPRWLLRLIAAIAPKADLVILLDAPAEIIQARKQEVPFEETARQCSDYRALVQPMRNGRVIDARGTPTEVIGRVNAIILHYAAAQAARRLGLERSR